MYVQFFGLKENPFNLVTDTRFLYYSESHCEAMAHLLYGVRERKGVILLLGEAGTGKTTLVRATLDMLRSTVVVPCVIMNPIISRPEELFEVILRGFKVEGFPRSLVEMSDVLQRFLHQQNKREHIPVLIVDEAQELSKPLLEQLRMLSNLEGNNRKLLQIVLAAQPEMAERIATAELRALKQRIVVRCRLQPLSPFETWEYLQTRLERAGAAPGSEIFPVASVEAIYNYSGGIPRLVNMIADNCLLAAYAQNRQTVEPGIVERVVGHLELQVMPGGEYRSGSVPEDVMRASSSWSEVVNDLRSGSVPEALRLFVEKLRVPNHGMDKQGLINAMQGER